MRDSPVSVSAPLRKLNAVSFVPLKIYFFGILRFRNIGLSVHWAVPALVIIVEALSTYSQAKYYQRWSLKAGPVPPAKTVPFCVHLTLSQYNLLTDAYHVIGLAYKFLLTLSITQVACERSLSTLTFGKNRLQSSLSQDNLEAFVLMCTEKEILMSISNDTVIDKVAETSALLRRLLMLCRCCWCYSQCNCILYCELNCKH